jgi:hypothetical protein
LHSADFTRLLSLLGSAGLGLVWGWLAAGFRTPMAHPLRTGLALATAALASGLVVAWLAGIIATLVFFAAVGVAAMSRHAWHRRLAERFGLPVTDEGDSQ